MNEVWTSGGSVSYGYNSNTQIADLDSIENVAGTSGTDVMFGNSVDNASTSGGFSIGAIEHFDGRGGSDMVDFAEIGDQEGGGAIWVDLALTGMEVWTSGGVAAYGYNANMAVANLVSIENIIGTKFSDSIYGNAGDNTYTFIGRSLDAALGDVDTFDGRDGSDTFSATLVGTDQFRSAIWADLDYTAMEGWTSGTDTATGANANTMLAQLTDVENLIGSVFNDTLLGDAGANRIEGGAGDDTMLGVGGNDRFVVSRELYVRPETGDDTIWDFSVGAGSDDVLVINGSGPALDSVAEVLAVASYANGDAVIALGTGSVTLKGVAPDSLHADDFFVSA